MARASTLLWAVPTTLAVLMVAKTALQSGASREPLLVRATPAAIKRLAPPGRLHVPSDARPVTTTARPRALTAPPAAPPALSGADPARRAAAQEAEPLEIMYPVAEHGAPPALADAWPGTAASSAAGEHLAKPASPMEPAAHSARQPASAPDRSQALAAVRQQIHAANEKSVKLALRGALYSARAELLDALRLLSQALDARDGTAHRVRALSAALTAMEESDDFTQSSGGAAVALADVIRPHQTPVLKVIEVNGLSPLTCSQHYFAFAQQQLTLAAGGEPAAAPTLYLLGKVHSQLAGQTANVRSAHIARAMVYHQTTLAIDPRHYQAANELGVLLARFGELASAKQMLLASLTSRATVSAWHNLASVHERLGETDLANKARYEAQLMAGKMPAGSNGQSVQWVDAATFAAQSKADGPAAHDGKRGEALEAGLTRPGASLLRR